MPRRGSRVPPSGRARTRAHQGGCGGGCAGIAPRDDPRTRPPSPAERRRRPGSRRTPRHRPGDRRTAGRLARPRGTVPDDRRRDDADAPCRCAPRSGSCAASTSRSPPGPACPTTLPTRLPLFRRDEGWPGEVIRTGRVQAWSDVRTIGGRGFERYAGVYDFVGLLVAPLIHHGRVIGALSAVTPAGTRLDERRHRLHQHAGHARRDRAVERRAAGADREARRPARDAPGGLRPDEPGRHGRAGRADRGRGDTANHRLPQRPGLSRRAARPGRPDRVRGRGGCLRASRPVAPAHPYRRGLHRLGRPARRAAPGQRRERRSARADDPRDRRRSTSRCWSSRCATTRSPSGSSPCPSWASTGSAPRICGC